MRSIIYIRNILSLYHWDHEDTMNWLSMSYEGNQLVKVADYGYNPVSYSSKHYQNGENAQKEMFYDKNGALVADFDRKNCAIQNNFLSLHHEKNERELLCRRLLFLILCKFIYYRCLH